MVQWYYPRTISLHRCAAHGFKRQFDFYVRSTADLSYGPLEGFRSDSTAINKARQWAYHFNCPRGVNNVDFNLAHQDGSSDGFVKSVKTGWPTPASSR